MNAPAISNALRVLRQNPALCVPHLTLPTFEKLPVPLSTAFQGQGEHSNNVDVRGVVLDKDNCFAAPKSTTVHASCKGKLQELVKHYGSANVLIVSNSSGLSSKDPEGESAKELELNTGLQVLRHVQPKPACGDVIHAFFGNRITHPSQIAVVGDRLFTDVVMANQIGGRSVWIKTGVVPDTGYLTKFEYALFEFLVSRGYKPPRA